jgi:hypothetical protein
MSKIQNQGSSWWMDNNFNTEYSTQENYKNRNTVNYVKLSVTLRAISNFVNIVTGKQIPVHFKSTDSSYTDGKTVTVGTDFKDTDFDPIVGLALHEASHIAFTDFDIIQHCTKIGSKFHSFVSLQGCDPDLNITSADLIKIKDILNWIEDRRIDYHIYTTAPGYRVYYEAMYNKYFNDIIINNALQQGEKCEETWDDYLFHIINFTNVNRQLDSLTALHEIWDLIDIKNINRLQSTQDALIVACGVYKLIKKAVAKSDLPKIKLIPSDAISIEITNDTPHNSSTKSTSLLSPKQQQKLENAIQQQKEFLNNNIKKKGRLSRADNTIVNTLSNSGTEYRKVDISNQTHAYFINTVVIKKFTRSVIGALPDIFNINMAKLINNNVTLSDVVMDNSKLRSMQQAVSEGIILGRQLGKKLQLRNEERSLKSTRLRTGRIDRRLISTIGFGNESIFQRIISDRYKNFFIHISIDASKSMNMYDRFHNAIKSAIAVAQAASMTTGIRVQISLRGTSTNITESKQTPITIYVYDSAHDKMSKINTLFPFLQPYGITPEGISIDSILQDIQRDAKSDECIFINYSDGMPSNFDFPAGLEYDGVDFTRRVVNKLKDANLHVISYFIDKHEHGICAKQFRTMYGKNSEFIDPTSLTEVSKSLNRKFLELVETT